MRLTVLVTIALGLIVFSYYVARDPAMESQMDSQLAACVTRGVAHFKEIGSYPLLSDGKYAERVADERCRRTLTAF
jgi:hypothetical protein